MKEIFKKKFGLPQNGFQEPIDLQDVAIGFSVYKNREDVGFKSLFRIFIKSADLNKTENLKPVTVTASYGQETGDGLILSSSEFKRKRNWPIDLISEGEFFYDIQSHQFFYKAKEISGIKILEIVDGWHTKPTKPFYGLGIRTKLFLFHTVFTKFFSFFFSVFAGLQYLISGKKIRIFHNLTDPKNRISPIERHDLIVNRGKPIKIFEYEVEPWIAVLYCLIHLFIYSVFYFYDYRPEFIATIFKNNFLTTMYGIISLGLMNALLPNILKPNQVFMPVLLFFQSLYMRSAFKKFKI